MFVEIERVFPIKPPRSDMIGESSPKPCKKIIEKKVPKRVTFFLFKTL